MQENQPLEYDEFYEKLWSGISAKIVSEEYIANNKEFIESITFDYYRLYELSNELSVSIIRRMVESFFFNAFRFKPALKNS